MEQYIDKSALIAEIERLKDEYLRHCNNNKFCAEWSCGTLDNILRFLDTFEVKEVDLAKELDNYFAEFKALEKTNWNWRTDSMNIHAQGIYEFAKYFFELGFKAQNKNKL